MSYDLLLALTLFAFVSSITPGPNNLMLMASGANFGFRRTLPHLLGVGIGFTLMIVLVGVGLVQVFDLYPISHQILKLVSVIYLLWLAWKIANAATPEGDVQSEGTPITFIQAALFQWVNPKAWFMAITAISAYAPQDQGIVMGSLIVAVVFAVVNLPSITIWAWMGVQVRRWLGSARRLRIFNVSMAVLLVVSLYPMLMH